MPILVRTLLLKEERAGPPILIRTIPRGNGTLGLRVLYTPENPIVDVIFIHGLTGNSFNTWYEEESGTYWPVDLLAHKDRGTRNARILTFG